MNKESFEVNPTLLRLAAGIPTAGLGGLIGYLNAPKEHRLEGMARGAGTGYIAGTGIGVGAELGSRAAPDGESTLPYTLSGALAGGGLGLGVGTMMQGTPAWEQRKKFREELLATLREEANKPRSDLQRPLQKLGASVLHDLLNAKSLSDKRDYKGKHAKLHELITKYPDDFFIDSIRGDIVGLTHSGTGFRLHAPIKTLPPNFRSRRLVDYHAKQNARMEQESQIPTLPTGVANASAQDVV